MIINLVPQIKLAIIDDHKAWREKLSEMLVTVGFNIIITATNGNVCLLDISMPVMDGYETAEKLRESYPKIKILAFSMDTDETVIARVITSGANGFIPKGVSLKELKNAIVEVYNTGFHL